MMPYVCEASTWKPVHRLLNGGLDMAACEFFDAETVWTSDIDPGACKIIAHRYPDVPNLGDITAIDWTAVEPVDILTGGFPCQDVSHAGKRAGLRPDTRSGLWSQMAYAISQLRPRYVVAENVRGLLSASAHSDLEPCPWCVGGAEQREPDLRALGAVLGDLAELGYDARWVGLRAADVGAPHGRFRVFILAESRDTDGFDRQRWKATGQQGQARPEARSTTNPERGGRDGRANTDGCGGADVAWGPYEPAIRRWEAVLARPAPAPTQESRPLRTTAERRLPVGMRGRIYRHMRLSPRFVEWMQGVPEGWVTDVPSLSRNAQLQALGNGVVPQQALAALQLLAPPTGLPTGTTTPGTRSSTLTPERLCYDRTG